MRSPFGSPKPPCGEGCPLAHTLNNRLSVILGCVDLMDDKVPADSEIAGLLRTIRESVRIMASNIRAHQRQTAALATDDHKTA